MTGDDKMDAETRLQRLKEIYARQHYFIDRHDSMAERFVSILLVEATVLSVVLALFSGRGSVVLPILAIRIVLALAFVVLFAVTLIKLLNVVQPLSSKAKSEGDESFVDPVSRHWIDYSSIYYRGIVSQIKEAREKCLIPADEYLKTIETKRLTDDLVHQILILAGYNDRKRGLLEAAKGWVFATTIVGLISALVLALF